MTKDEQEYHDFIYELTNKAKEFGEKFDRLSDNNKRRFYTDFKPIIDSSAFAWLFGNKQ